MYTHVYIHTCTYGWISVWYSDGFFINPVFPHGFLTVLTSAPHHRHLLDNGAFPAPVNNEGDTPEDLADDESIRDLLLEAVEKQGMAV